MVLRIDYLLLPGQKLFLSQVYVVTPEIVRVSQVLINAANSRYSA